MTTLTIHLDDATEATLRRIAEDQGRQPEELVLDNLRVSMRDFLRNRLSADEWALPGRPGRARSHIINDDYDGSIPTRVPPPEWG